MTAGCSRGGPDGPQPGTEGILAGLLRRSAQDREALAACYDGLVIDPDPLVATVLRFPQILIGRGDRNAHTISNAMEAAGKVGLEFCR